MSKKLKLTPWFAEGVNPHSVGPYQVGFKSFGSGRVHIFPMPYHFYTGAGWVNDCSFKPEVLSGRTDSLTGIYMKGDTYFWRGLAVAP